MSASYLDPVTDLLGDVFSTVNYQQRGLPPTTIRAPYTVEANVADAVAVIDQVAGERAWIVGHSWGGHLALHLLAACPERLEGAIILDPLGAYLEVFEEFGTRMTAPLSDAQRARAEELDAKEERGEATLEESQGGLQPGLAVLLRRSRQCATVPRPRLRRCHARRHDRICAGA